MTEEVSLATVVTVTDSGKESPSADVMGNGSGEEKRRGNRATTFRV